MSNKKKVTSKVTGLVAGATVGTMLALASGIPAFAAPADPVNFADQNFKTCVAGKLGVDPASVITEGQMATITSLVCDTYQNGITNLAGAEYLTSVTQLNLSNSDVADLTPIAGLTQLTSLQLSRTNVTDFAPIAGLTNLGSLFIADTGITSLAGAENLTNLSYLVINDTEISDITPLDNLPLTNFVAYGTSNLSDLTPLAYKGTLDRVFVTDSAVTDVTPLTTLPNIRVLDLSENNLDNADLAVLSTITGLEELMIYNANISDITPVSALTNLKTLQLNNNSVVNGLPIQGNKIVDLSPVSALSNLTYLQVGGNNIKDVSPLSGLTNLQWLYLNNNEITNLSPLVGLSNITQFDATGQRLATTGTVDAGTPVPFNVTAIDGSSVAANIVPASAGSYDNTTRTITYTEGGTVNFNWSVPVVLGSVLATFSGSGSQLVEADIPAAPEAPANVTAVAGSNSGEVNLSWDAVTNTNGNGAVASYLIEYRLVGATTWTNSGNATTTNTVVSGLTPGASYEFRVAAVAANNAQGAFSTVVTASAAPDEDTTAPAVTGVNVTNVTAKTATVNWTPVTDTNGNGTVTKYTVAVGSGNSGDAIDVDADVNSFELTVNPETTYGVVVSYTTSTGATGQSTLVNFTTPEATDLPAPALTGLNSKAGEKQGTIDLTWVAISDTAEGTAGNGNVENYNIRYRAVGATEWIAVGKYAGDNDTNSGSLINLAAGSFEIALSYTTDTGVTSPEAFTTATVVNGIPNGANGNNGGNGNGNGAGNGSTDNGAPTAAVRNSDVTPTGADTGLLVGGIAALTLLSGAGIYGFAARKRKEQVTV